MREKVLTQALEVVGGLQQKFSELWKPEGDVMRTEEFLTVSKELTEALQAIGTSGPSTMQAFPVFYYTYSTMTIGGGIGVNYSDPCLFASRSKEQARTYHGWGQPDRASREPDYGVFLGFDKSKEGSIIFPSCFANFPAYLISESDVRPPIG